LVEPDGTDDEGASVSLSLKPVLGPLTAQAPAVVKAAGIVVRVLCI
jgi:hypothetical protein